MALSGSVSTSAYSGRYYKLSWSATQSVADNKSSISWTLEALGGEANWYAERTLKVVIAGSTVFSKSNRVERIKGVIASGSTDVTHNSDGTKSFSISVQAAVYGTEVNCTGSNTFTLNTIGRTSTLTAYDGTLGTSLNLSVSRQSTSFTHTITYRCGSATGTVCTKSSSTSVAWNTSNGNTLDLAKQNTKGESVSVTFQITTYNGSTEIGSYAMGVTMSIPSSVVPSCSIDVSDATGYESTYGGYIKGMSKLAVTITATPSYNSPISSYKTTVNDTTYATASFTTDVLKTTGGMAIITSVTDERNRTKSATKTITVKEYSPPTITKLAVNRCDQNGNIKDDGNHIKVTYSGTISSLGTRNSHLWELQYKKTTETDAYYQKETLNSTSYSITDGTFIFAADTEFSYDVKLLVSDDFYNANTDLKPVAMSTSASTAYTLLDFGEDGTSIGVGKVAEISNLLDVGFRLRTNGGLLQPILEDGTNLNNLLTPNTYTLKNVVSANYSNCPASLSTSASTSVLRIESCGESGQLRQVLTLCNSTKPCEYERFYYINSAGTAMMWYPWKRTTEVVLYDNASGSAATIPLSETVANFKYIEIFYTDNNGVMGGYTKLYSPNGKTVGLSIIEASTYGNTYIRRTHYTVSGTSLTPDLTTSGYMRYDPTQTENLSHYTGENLIKIKRVVGYE